MWGDSEVSLLLMLAGELNYEQRMRGFQRRRRECMRGQRGGEGPGGILEGGNRGGLRRFIVKAKSSTLYQRDIF